MEYIKLRKMMAIITVVALVIVMALCYVLIRPEVDVPIEQDTTLKEPITNHDFDAEDLDDTWDESSSNTISLNGSEAEISGKGALLSDGVITITQDGVYVLSGTSDTLQIVVSANKDTDTVKLVLNGLSIAHTNAAPLYIKSAKKTIVTLAKGSVNSLTDTSTDEGNADEEKPNATLFSQDDLVINGTGSLSIQANDNHGIVSKDDLKIVSGTFLIDARNDALKGKDSVVILDGIFDLKTGGDGIQASNTSDATKGIVTIYNGNFKIQSNGDGIQAETTLMIYDGIYAIDTIENNTESSNKGLKSGLDMTVMDGEFTVNATDDAFHANANMTIHSGTFTITTQDDGMHANEDLTIHGGLVNILKSYEGLEGNNVIVNGGTIHLVTEDDGINAAGGNDIQETSGNRVDHFKDTEAHRIEINGGTVWVDANGDGLDSNGDLMLNGGIVVIHGPENDGDASLDYDGIHRITGGDLIAAGSRGMVTLPVDDSTQASILILYDAKIPIDTSIKLKNSVDETIVEFTSIKSLQSLTLSNSNLNLTETYSVYQNDSLLFEVTLNDTVTVVDNEGNPVDAMQNGQRPTGKTPSNRP